MNILNEDPHPGKTWALWNFSFFIYLRNDASTDFVYPYKGHHDRRMSLISPKMSTIISKLFFKKIIFILIFLTVNYKKQMSPQLLHEMHMNLSKKKLYQFFWLISRIMECWIIPLLSLVYNYDIECRLLFHLSIYNFLGNKRQLLSQILFWL